MRLLKLLDEKFEEVVGGVTLAIVVLLIFAGVVMRVGFKSGIPWQEELSRVLFVFTLYLGASYGIKSDDHIRVTLLRDALPKAWRSKLIMFTDLVWITFNIAVIYYAVKNLLGPMSEFVAHTAYLDIDLRIPFAIVPALIGLQTVRLLQFFHAKYIAKTVSDGRRDDSCS